MVEVRKIRVKGNKVVKLWTRLVEKINLYDWEALLMRVAIITIFAFLVWLALVISTNADELKDLGRISPDAIRTDRLNILDKDGDIIYYIEMDRMDTRRAIIYDEDGDEAGTIQPDLIRPGGGIIKSTSRFRRFND